MIQIINLQCLNTEQNNRAENPHSKISGIPFGYSTVKTVPVYFSFSLGCCCIFKVVLSLSLSAQVRGLLGSALHKDVILPMLVKVLTKEG